MDITELLAFSAKQNASDLHLSAGLPPMIRVDGDVRRINVPPMEHREVHSLIYEIMNDRQRRDYEEFLETDFSFEVPGVARFRVNAFNHNRGAGAVFRTIPSKVLTLEEREVLLPSQWLRTFNIMTALRPAISAGQTAPTAERAAGTQRRHLQRRQRTAARVARTGHGL